MTSWPEAVTESARPPVDSDKSASAALPHVPSEANSRDGLLELLIVVLLLAAFFVGPLKLLGNSWFAYLGVDGIAVLVLLVVIAQRVTTRKPILARSPLTVPIVLLIGYCVLELANPAAPFVRSVIGLRSWVLYLCFFFVGLYGLRSIRQLERLYVLLLIVGVLTASYGIYQWRAGPQAFASWSDPYGRYAQVMWTFGSQTTAFRAFSTFVLPNTFGENMALIMLLAFSVSMSSTTPIRWRLLCGVAFAIMGLGIAVSGSRGPVAHLLLTLALALAFTRRERRLRTAAIAFLLGGVALLTVALSIGSVMNARFFTMVDPNAFFGKWFYPLSGGLSIAWTHPLGMGLGYTAGIPSFLSSPVLRDLPTTNIDSGYGSAAAELGLVGLGFFLYLAMTVGLTGYRSWAALPKGRVRDVLIGPALICASYPIVSLVFQPQATLPSSIYCWLLAGVLVRAPALLGQQNHTEQKTGVQVHPGQ
jgi:putative inorganic carbon (HCO3(-)) transporter